MYTISLPLHKNQNYFAALSFGTSPGIPLPDGRVFPLNPDALFFLSPNLIANNRGVLDNNGQAVLRFTMPREAYHGLQVYLAFLTYIGQNIAAVSSARLLSVRTQCS